MVKRYDFSDVFKGLSSAKLPDFEHLLNLPIEERGSPEELEDEGRARVGLELKAIHEICASHGFLPLVSELALIVDIRLYREERREPYFISAISVFLEPLAISQIYLGALQFMGTQAAGRAQIVPHPELYLADVALINADLSDGMSSDAGSAGIRPAEDPLRILAVKQDFVLQIPQPGFDLEAQVRRFLGRFCSLLRSTADTTSVWPTFQNASFMIVPFTRPMSGSAAILSIGDEKWNYRGYPGGALFLMLSDERGGDDRNARLFELARSLHWLLAECGMRESYSRFYAEEHTTRAFLSYQITHPLKHRLGSLNRQIDRVTDLQGQEEFPAALVRLAKSVKNTYRFADLAHILYHAAWVGQRSPFRAEREAGIMKFCTAESLDLVELLRQVIEDQPVGRLQPRPILSWEEGARASVTAFALGRTAAELVRLNDVFYEAVLQEVVQNVVAHGRRGDHIELSVRRSVVDGRNALTLTNEVEMDRMMPSLAAEGEKWAKWRINSPSGLSFVADALAMTGSGSLSFRCQRKDADSFLFSVALVLEGLE